MSIWNFFTSALRRPKRHSISPRRQGTWHRRCCVFRVGRFSLGHKDSEMVRKVYGHIGPSFLRDQTRGVPTEVPNCGVAIRTSATDQHCRHTLKSRLVTSRRPGAWKAAILTSGKAEGSGLR
jgi:hypothetical protein